MANPRASGNDLTAKARIRNAALDLYAEYGASRISLRAVAAEAGVTLGLVQHHFKTKAGLLEAVDQVVVDYFEGALREVDGAEISGQHRTPADHMAARDEAVCRMLEQNPPVVNFVRRALLEPSDDRMHLLDVLVDLTKREVDTLRESGMSSQNKRQSTQIVAVLVRQMGELLLRPMVDAVWDRVADQGDSGKPRLSIKIVDD